MEGIESRDIIRIEDDSIQRDIDYVSVESPLSIKISSKDNLDFSLGLLMRTPGNDSDLIKGLLYNEGIISSKSDIIEIIENIDYNRVILSNNVEFNPQDHNR